MSAELHVHLFFAQRCGRCVERFVISSIGGVDLSTGPSQERGHGAATAGETDDSDLAVQPAGRHRRLRDPPLTLCAHETTVTGA